MSSTGFPRELRCSRSKAQRGLCTGLLWRNACGIAESGKCVMISVLSGEIRQGGSPPMGRIWKVVIVHIYSSDAHFQNHVLLVSLVDSQATRYAAVGRAAVVAASNAFCLVDATFCWFLIRARRASACWRRLSRISKLPVSCVMAGMRALERVGPVYVRSTLYLLV